MEFKKELTEEKLEIKDLFNRFRKRNFKGNTGQAIKNSSYQFVNSLATKIGSLLFTIIIARLLLPELFGLYGLALSVIMFFMAFSDLGLGTALMTFVAKNDKNPKKAKAYFIYLLKWKLILIATSTSVLLALSYYLANSFYSKPIFFALVAGALYIPFNSFLGFLRSSFNAMNNFKYPLFSETIFQGMRLILVPLVILFAISRSFSQEIIVFAVIISLAFCFSLAFLFMVFVSKNNLFFLQNKSDTLNISEKKELIKYTLPLSITAFSGMFFGSIDVLMLGRFVSSEFIGYYQAALNLVFSGASILSFASASIFPILVRLSGKRLERGFKKIIRLMLLISFAGALFTFLIAPFAIKIIYGTAYSPGINLLRIFSLLVLTFPIEGIYITYYLSTKKTLTNAIILGISTITNILLNLIAIFVLLPYGMMAVVTGVCVSTIISKLFYLGGLIVFRRRGLGFFNKD